MTGTLQLSRGIASRERFKKGKQAVFRFSIYQQAAAALYWIVTESSPEIVSHLGFDNDKIEIMFDSVLIKAKLGITEITVADDLEYPYEYEMIEQNINHLIEISTHLCSSIWTNL